jgi:hypothetical protein
MAKFHMWLRWLINLKVTVCMLLKGQRRKNHFYDYEKIAFDSSSFNNAYPMIA